MNRKECAAKLAAEAAVQASELEADAWETEFAATAAGEGWRAVNQEAMSRVLKQSLMEYLMHAETQAEATKMKVAEEVAGAAHEAAVFAGYSHKNNEESHVFAALPIWHENAVRRMEDFNYWEEKISKLKTILCET